MLLFKKNWARCALRYIYFSTYNNFLWIAKNVSNKICGEIEAPMIVGVQCYRLSYNHQTLEDYYRLSTFRTFFDCLHECF